MLRYDSGKQKTLCICTPWRWKTLFLTTGGKKHSHDGHAFDPAFGHILCSLTQVHYGFYQREESHRLWTFPKRRSCTAPSLQSHHTDSGKYASCLQNCEQFASGPLFLLLKSHFFLLQCLFHLYSSRHFKRAQSSWLLVTCFLQKEHIIALWFFWRKVSI